MIPSTLLGPCSLHYFSSLPVILIVIIVVVVIVVFLRQPQQQAAAAGVARCINDRRRHHDGITSSISRPLRRRARLTNRTRVTA